MQHDLRKPAKILLCACLLAMAMTVLAHADIGPKPSVTVEFRGFEGRQYYATLLSKESRWGPYSVFEGDEDSYFYGENVGNPQARVAFLKFAGYEDADGFFFLQFMQECSQTHAFGWGYYPPEEFKILVYFADTDEFLVSEGNYTRYAFHSQFVLSADGSVERDYPVGRELGEFALRAALTVAVELIVALCFLLRGGKLWRLVALTNLGTQVLLNAALQVTIYMRGAWLGAAGVYLLLELGVTAAEAAVYLRYFPRLSARPRPKWLGGVYALV
ncbi:MAG: hypothetical protein FWC27_01550, partial [Firmicutes bacterium]|nr:hypothetical protein [Bacillota bacterium]